MKKQVVKLSRKPVLQRLTNVAAYARVSSGKDAMLHSLAAQVSYYSNLIQNHPGWRYAGVYADEAVTGTKDTRGEFQRLLSDCRAGRVDMIITKSVSRFARNTVTSLETVRELKAIGVDVYFEEQRIHSMSSDGELMLTILSAFAQEESRSASDNQKWRIRKAFENGEPMNTRMMLGYRITKKNGIEIDPEQAEVIKEIYARVIRGDSLSSIVRWLNRSGRQGIRGGRWTAGRVRDTVSNEKYMGDSLLQKSFRNNHIEKKMLRNHGEFPQYYATETHPAIIDRATFTSAQQALARISTQKPAAKPKSSHIFTGMIICSACGKTYHHMKNHGKSRWVCQTYFLEGKDKCLSRQIPEETIMELACSVLGRDSFDDTVFHKTVDHLTAIYPNTLVFHLRDGREICTEWQNRSRSKSWTPEMRAKAASDARKRGHQSMEPQPFLSPERRPDTEG